VKESNFNEMEVCLDLALFDVVKSLESDVSQDVYVSEVRDALLRLRGVLDLLRHRVEGGVTH
jgi:hypothetical protein